MANWRTWLVALLLCLQPLLATAAAGSGEVLPGLSPDEALRLGERMYRHGLLPSGEPMQALVQGDIVVDGTMFSCESCHLRSGMGSNEGEVITLPTNATELFKPFTKAAEEVHPGWSQVPDFIDGGIRRPAYTEAALAEALRNGIDPAGRELSLVMPRYALDDREMAILVYYLKNLSAAPSPGVDATTMHLATVVSADLPSEQRAALIDTLRAYIDARNGQSRQQARRAKTAPFYDRLMYAPFRRLELHVWELSGPRESWAAQLDDHYRRTPVFAVLSGMVSGDWTPVHQFCERQRLPCLFPLTKFPVIAKDDWYTLYFSKGYYQEGEAVARYLKNSSRQAPVTRILQVYRDDPAGRALRQGFLDSWQKSGGAAPVDRPLPPGQPLESLWPQLLQEAGDGVVLLWAGRESLPLLATWPQGAPARLFLSAGLLGRDLSAVPEQVRGVARIAYPYRLPGKAQTITNVVRNWLKYNRVPESDLAVQADAYYIVGHLSNVLMMMKTDYYRDYLLDVTDMMNDADYTIANYPRLSFGPGQRYAAKGCYIVAVDAAGVPQPVEDGEWMAH
jgi:ABC-type branched-subunit amino acid transport system substrate-binding protein